MRFKKNITVIFAFFAIYSIPVRGQMINHTPPPPQPPPPQITPPQAPPSLPNIQFIPPSLPIIPQHIAQPAPPSTPDDYYKTNPEYLKTKDQLNIQFNIVQELKDKFRILNDFKRNYSANGYVFSKGSLEEAVLNLDHMKNSLSYAEQYLLKSKETLANLLEIKAKEKITTKYGVKTATDFAISEAQQKVAQAYANVTYYKSNAALWTAEASARTSKKDQVENELEQLRVDLEVEQTKYEKLMKERRALENEHEKDIRQEEALAKINQDGALADDLESDEFFDGAALSKSSETADISPTKTMQELREDSLRDAFSEMNSLNFQTGFLEKIDVAGQVSQTVVGFIPGLSTYDVAFSGARGFAEALGEEMAKGTSWEDSLKIAAVNAGLKGAVSIVGNHLTGGADKLANRVAVLTEVGFSKLSTKQIAEYGGKGISFLVIKSGQVLGQTATEELAGKPAMKKVVDWIKDDKNTSQVTGSGGYSGGFGTSMATQPHVAY